MNQEAIELLKKALETGDYDTRKYIDQAIALLEQQPKYENWDFKKWSHQLHLRDKTGKGLKTKVDCLFPPEQSKPSEFTKLVKERNILFSGDLHELKCVLKKACDLLNCQQKPITENPDVQRLISQVVRLEAELGNYKSNWDALAKDALEFEAENEKLKEHIGKIGDFAWQKHCDAKTHARGDLYEIAEMCREESIKQVLDPIQQAAEKCKETGSPDDLKKYLEARQKND